MNSIDLIISEIEGCRSEDIRQYCDFWVYRCQSEGISLLALEYMIAVKVSKEENEQEVRDMRHFAQTEVISRVVEVSPTPVKPIEKRETIITKLKNLFGK